MLLDILSVSLWPEFRIFNVMVGCISFDDENLYNRCLLAVAYVDGDWMLDILWMHILPKEN